MVLIADPITRPYFTWSFLPLLVAIIILPPCKQAFSEDRGECSGVLHEDQNGLHFGGGDQEDEGICVISKSQESKVLAICSAGEFCKVRGNVRDCKDPGECVEISDISSVARGENDNVTESPPFVVPGTNWVYLGSGLTT
jgi:hypothetical protein